MRSHILIIYHIIFCFVLSMTSNSSEEIRAIIEARNGKKMKVIIEGIDESNLNFMSSQLDSVISVPLQKIFYLQFFTSTDFDSLKDEALIESSSNALKQLSIELESFIPYMGIRNNLHPFFFIYLDLLLANKHYDEVYDTSKVLKNASDSYLKNKGLYYEIWSKIGLKDEESAQYLIGNIDDPAASIYFNARLAYFSKDYDRAISEIIKILTDYKDNVEWLALSELLMVELYLDMGMVNSAINTARQVHNFYNGTTTAIAAERIYNKLNKKN